MVTPYDSRNTTDGEARRHIRGSTLLLSGRVISLGLNFAAQILTVRYLSKAEFGSFAFALSLVSLGTAFSVMGLDTTVRHFAPLYEEQRAYRKLAGAIVLTFGCILVLAITIFLLIVGWAVFFGDTLASSSLSLSLVLCLIVLTPIEAIDSFLVSLFAAFARPRAIFFRTYLLGPSIKLGAVVLVILSGGNVYLLAGGYAVGSILGLLICATMLASVVRQRGLVEQLGAQGLEIPAREIFGYSLPQISSVISFQLRTTFAIVLLENFLSSASVAEYRAVLPLAKLNEAVMATFALLFVPAAARLFARENKAGIECLYWQTTAWITVLSFPLFALSFVFSETTTVLLFGQEYASSAPVLALLALGCYFNAMMGFNAHTLRAAGQVRFVFISDLITIALAITAQFMLIPRYGPLGAAIATCVVLGGQNVVNQLGLFKLVGINPFRNECVACYTSVVVATLVLLQVQQMVSPSFQFAFVLTTLAFAAVLLVNRSQLDVSQTLPELNRVPMLRWIIG
jgi:O-antigen/teichoic acid export membrane protein